MSNDVLLLRPVSHLNLTGCDSAKMVKKVLAPGQYFVGDPSRVMQAAFYDAMIEAMHDKTEACFELNKATIVAQDIGDADSVTGSDGFEYHSASGLLGLTPQSLSEGANKGGQGGKWAQFNMPVTFQSNAGRILITSPGYRLDIAISPSAQPTATQEPAEAPKAAPSRAPRNPKGAPLDKASRHALGKCLIGVDRLVYRVEKNKAQQKVWRRCSTCTAN